MNKSVGISAIATYIPKLYLDLTAEWSEARASNNDTESAARLRSKISQGIGITKMALPDFHEDSATLAANAVKKLIDQSGLDLSKIDSIAIGTESAVDMSKSMASYVLGMIERHYNVDLSHVNCPHFQFACIGATYALESALNCLLAGTNRRPYHIVVATDIAKYPIDSIGEPTQGGGAIAMLVTENPTLLSIDISTIGTCTRDESDFFRPNFLKSAIVDGKRSVSVYCDTMEKAAHYFIERNDQKKVRFDDFAAFVFHVPFPKMAEYAAVRLFRTLWNNEPLYKELMESVKSDSLVKEELALRRHTFFKTCFDKKVRLSLNLPEQVGNIYSGSLYLALVSLIEGSLNENINFSNQDILLISYGSGANSKVFRATFCSNYFTSYRDNVTQELKDKSEGGRRYRASVEQYKRLHCPPELSFVPDNLDGAPISIKEIIPIIDGNSMRVCLQQRPESILKPQNEFFLKQIGTKLEADKSDLGYRYYAFAESSLDDTKTNN